MTALLVVRSNQSTEQVLPRGLKWEGNRTPLPLSWEEDRQPYPSQGMGRIPTPNWQQQAPTAQRQCKGKHCIYKGGR